jgi:hypothetical protein
MSKLTSALSATPSQLLTRLPWFRKLMQYSFLFFLVKGLLWTAVLMYPLLKGIAWV